MSNKPVLLMPPGSISKEDKKKLEENDYIVIEIDKPEKIKHLQDVEILYGNDIFMSLVSAMDYGNGSADTKYGFAKEFLKRIHNKAHKAG